MTEIIFPGRIAGLNGPGGLLRLHHTQRTKLKEQYIWTVRAATKARHAGPVRFELWRFSTGPDMDFDNIVSTGKAISDAIVACGVILDDKPAIIVQREYRQVKVKTKDEQRTVIRIYDVPLEQDAPVICARCAACACHSGV